MEEDRALPLVMTAPALFYSIRLSDDAGRATSLPASAGATSFASIVRLLSLARIAARLASYGLAETLLLEELLFADGKYEVTATVFARDFLVF
jgi:hypothetical protein